MDIPVWQMILRSGLIIKSIMIILTALSITSWAIVFLRLFWLHGAQRRNNAVVTKIAGLKSLSGIDKLPRTYTASLFGRITQLGAAEIKRILTEADVHTEVTNWTFFLQNQFTITRERLESKISAMTPRIFRGLFVLAIVSTVSPFLGMLGTVWGIMHSFYQISHQGSASLPVVAPGIAEALITTIVGLAVAIPAVFFYNYLNHQAEKLEDALDGFKEMTVSRVKQEIMTLLFAPRNAESSSQ